MEDYKMGRAVIYVMSYVYYITLYYITLLGNICV